MIIKSPLNYSGSKNYIVDQILAELPSDLKVFVDMMGGAFNVGINVKNAKKIVYNEINPFVFEMISMLLNTSPDEIISEINQIINYFKLKSGDKASYYSLRDYYNENKKPILLFVLEMYCFQNQLRFNNKHNFNTPIGNSGYNENIKQRIFDFHNNNKCISLFNLDYKDIKLSSFPSNTLFYFDPPYLITNATYNDGKRGFKGWDVEQEIELLNFLDTINNNKQKFMLSNVLVHNGKKNTILYEWAINKNYEVIKLKPHNGRYGAREEVLITNFKRRQKNENNSSNF